MNKTTFDKLKSVFNFKVEGKSNIQLTEYAEKAYSISCLISVEEPDYRKIMKSMQDIIIKYGSPHLICKFAINKGSNKTVLLNQLENSNDVNLQTYLASSMNLGTKIDLLEKAIIRSGDLRYIYEFAMKVKGANIENLGKAIIRSGDVKYICAFAQHVKGANIKNLEKAIIRSGSAMLIYAFAQYVTGANIENLEKAIVKTIASSWICKFAVDVDGANVHLLEQAFIKLQNANYACDFARGAKGANIQSLENLVVKYGDLYTIQEFSENIRFCNIKRLQGAMFKRKTNTKEWKINSIKRFFKDIPEANIEWVSNKLIEEYSLQEFKAENKAYTSKEVRKMMSDAKKNIR